MCITWEEIRNEGKNEGKLEGKMEASIEHATAMLKDGALPS